MPNTRSAKKRLRQSLERRERNRAVKSSLKTHSKSILAAVAAGQLDQAEQQFRVAAARFDRAGARNVLHRNTVARRKSRLQRVIKAAKQGRGQGG